MGPPPRARGGLLKRRWRLLRALGALALGLSAMLVAVLLTLAVGIRTEAGRAFVRDRLVALLQPPRGHLSVGELDTDLFSWFELHDVRIADASGVTLVEVDRLQATYALGGLPAGRLVVSEVRAEGVNVLVNTTSEGLDLAEIWDDGSPPSTEPWSGLPIDLDVRSVTVAPARFRYRDGETELGVDAASIAGRVALVGPAVKVDALRVDAPRTEPDLGALALDAAGRWDPTTLYFDRIEAAIGGNTVSVAGGLGRLGGDGTVGLDLRALHVDVGSLAAVTGALPVVGAFDVSGHVGGRAVAPTADLDVVTPGGSVRLTGLVNLAADRPQWTATLALPGLDVHAFVPDAPEPSEVRGVVNAEGRGLGWPHDLDATAVFALESPRLATLDGLAASGGLRLADGVVSLVGLHATGPGASVRGAGVVRVLEGTGEAEVGNASADLRILRRFGVEAGGDASFRGKARFSWGDALGGTAEGEIAGDEVALPGVATVGHVSGPLSARWDAADGAKASGVLAFSRLSAGGVSASSGSADAELTVAPDRAMAVEGTAALSGLLGPDLRGEGVDARFRLTRSPAGRLDGEATVTTAPVAWRGIGSERGGGHVTLAGDLLTARLDLLDGDRTVIGFDGEVDLAASSLRARRIELSPSPEVTWRSDGVQHVTLVPGGVKDVGLRFTSGGSVLTAEGYGARKQMVDLAVEAKDVDVGSLGAFAPELAGFAGRVTLRASMEGHASRPSLYVDLAADDLTIPDVVHGVDVDLQAVGGDHRLKLDGALADGPHTLAKVKGELPFSLAIDAPGLRTEGDLDLHLVLPASDATQWNAVLARTLPEARASGEIVLTGPVLDPSVHAVVSAEAPFGAQGEWIRFDLDADTRDGALQVRGVARERLERRLRVDGALTLGLDRVARGLAGEAPAPDYADPAAWVSRLALDVTPLRLPVRAIRAFVPDIPARLGGDVSGTLHLAGDLPEVRADGDLALVDGHLGDLRFSGVDLRLRSSALGYQPALFVRVGTTEVLAVTGFVPFSSRLDADLAAELARPGLLLEVHGEEIPLEAVAGAWPDLQADGGTLRLSGKVTGSLADPDPDVDFGMDAGDFVLAATGVAYCGARFDGHLGKDDARITGLEATTARRGCPDAKVPNKEATGSVKAWANARREGDRPAIEGQLEFSRAWLADLPEHVARASGRLRLGDAAGKLRVTGDVDLVEGQETVPERFFVGNGDLALDPDIVVIRPGVESAPTARRQAAALVLPDWLDADVTVRLQRNAFLDVTMPTEQLLGEVFAAFSSAHLSAQLDGDLQVGVHDGRISVEGEVEPLRGNATLLGVGFDVTGEKIAFTGRDYTDPVLDLVAEHDAGEYGIITTTVTGTPSAPHVAFTPEDSSLPPEDVLAVLILGRPTSELDPSEGQGALTAALGALVRSAAVQSASGGGLFGLDLFEFDSGGSLRFGRRIGDKLFLLGRIDPDPDPDENPFEVTLEAQLYRAWQLDVTTGTQGVSSMGLNRKWKF